MWANVRSHEWLRVQVGRGSSHVAVTDGGGERVMDERAVSDDSDAVVTLCGSDEQVTQLRVGRSDAGGHRVSRGRVRQQQG